MKAIILCFWSVQPSMLLENFLLWAEVRRGVDGLRQDQQSGSDRDCSTKYASCEARLYAGSNEGNARKPAIDC